MKRRLEVMRIMLGCISGRRWSAYDHMGWQVQPVEDAPGLLLSYGLFMGFGAKPQDESCERSELLIRPREVRGAVSEANGG